MKIGALQKFSLIEYPGKISAIVFTQGCNFRCPYCYNRELVDPVYYKTLLSENDVFSFLQKRRNKLDAVTITGGEPSLQPDLLIFLQQLKKMNYLVKVDSNGSYPEILEEMLEKDLVDYIALDIKAPLEKYAQITQSEIQPDKIKRSIDSVMSSGVDYEFRTTVVASLLSRRDLVEIARMIPGAKCYALQRFIASKTLDASFMNEKSYQDEDFTRIVCEIRPFVSKIIIR
jgi:pyruvate formate lyase activating enzyme